MKSPNGITTIFFDLDDTLRHNDPNAHYFLWEHAASLGAPDSPEYRRHAYQWAYEYWADSTRLAEDIDIHGRGEESFWHNYTQRHLLALGCTLKQAEDLAPHVQKHMSENYQPEDVVLPEVRHTLRKLHATGYTLAVVTNRHEPVDDYLQELELREFFDFSLAGGEINSWKPKPEIFEEALVRASAKPEEAIYVGDNYYADILGARKVGIQPILLDPHDHFPEADCHIIRSLAELVGVLAITQKS
jgi:putative hydrolase of the HAD superfamily